jgi:hypothetical protein
MTAREVSEQLRLRELLALRAAVGKSQGAGTKFKMANSHAITKANLSSLVVYAEALVDRVDVPVLSNKYTA